MCQKRLLTSTANYAFAPCTFRPAFSYLLRPSEGPADASIHLSWALLPKQTPNVFLFPLSTVSSEPRPITTPTDDLTASKLASFF